MQVPPDAKLLGQAFLGSSSSWGASLLVNTWQGALPQNGKRDTGFSVMLHSFAMIDRHTHLLEYGLH